MKVYITTAYDDPEPISSFLRLAKLDKHHLHEIVEFPEFADIILFIENSRYHKDFFFSKLENHPLVKQYPQIVYMYNPHDHPWFVLPGLYASMPKRYFSHNNIVATPFIESINPFITHTSNNNPKFLFSFAGNANSSSRRAILKLHCDRAYLESTPQNMFVTTAPVDSKERYASLLSNSKFILCPKGAGTSSFRIFETMQAGRVPVIVSDEWVSPPGPDWNSFSIFVRDKNVSHIPAILKQEEQCWEDKASKARAAWCKYFAPETIFNYLIDSLEVLVEQRTSSALWYKLETLYPFARYWVRKKAINKVKALWMQG